MDASLIVLIPISVLIVAGVILVLWWAARSGQFDDLEGPAHAILMDDDTPGASVAGSPGVAPKPQDDPDGRQNTR